MYEQLKETSRAFFEEVWNKGDLNSIAKYVLPEIVTYDPTAPGGEIRGLDSLRTYVTTYRTAFPDLHFVIDEMVADGEFVLTRWTATGTHTGAFMDIAPSGKYGTVTGISFSRFANGKFVETYVSKDDLGLFQLIGKVPVLFPELATV